MKNTLLITGLILLSTLSAAQSDIDSLVREGIKFHDQQQYDQALNVYQKALEMNPQSPLVNYEMAMTYMYAGNYKKSIQHADQVISLDDKYLLQAYMAKGSCLDYLGKTNESIRLFEEGIEKFGPHHLFFYNMGYNYYKINNQEKAKENLVKAIRINPNHSTSHLLLGYLMNDMGNDVQSLLSLHYFLFLEPNTQRARNAWTLLQELFAGNVEHEKDNQINIHIDSAKADGPFGPALIMISMLEASKAMEEKKGKTEEELFIKHTNSFFTTLGELNKEEHDGVWWNFYVPFFYDIARSDQMDTYCYYISQSSKKESVDWLNLNDEKLNQFLSWLQKEK